ncbi:hypothetical protein [Noviherbaspirillum aridicola]|nr:hypothetical protein [Noviherbaspirillum aridicola]
MKPDYTGMDDPRWMKKTQEMIDEYFERLLREKPGRRKNDEFP